MKKYHWDNLWVEVNHDSDLEGLWYINYTEDCTIMIVKQEELYYVVDGFIQNNLVYTDEILVEPDKHFNKAKEKANKKLEELNKQGKITKYISYLFPLQEENNLLN